MTNLQIAKLYLATNTTADAAQIDTAVTTNLVATTATITALSAADFLEAAYQAAFGRPVDAEGAAYWADRMDNGMTQTQVVDALPAGAAAYVAPTAENPLVIGGVTFTAAQAGVSAANDVVVAANKAVAEAAAGTATVGSIAAAVVTVTEVASTVTVATEAIDNAEYAAAATAYDAAVATAAISKAAADAAALTVTSVTLATASQTAATAASTDATAVVTAATALVAAAADTVSAADNITAATAATTAAAAATTAAGLVTVATTAVTTATEAAAAAAATGTTFVLTDDDVSGNSADLIFGTEKSDIITGTSADYDAADIIADSSVVDADTMTLTITDDMIATPTIIGIENITLNVNSATTPTATATVLNVNATAISSSNITIENTLTGSLVTTATLTALNDGVDVTTGTTFDSVDVEMADGASNTVTINNTDATLTTTAVTGGIDEDMTITAAGDLDIDGLAVQGTSTITTTGDLALSSGAATVSNTIDATVGGDLTVTDLDGAAGVAFTATVTGDATITNSSMTGDVTITATDVLVKALTATDGTVTLTASGNVDNDSDTEADGNGVIADAATTLTATSTGGYVEIASADSATTITLTAAEQVVLTSADEATSITLSAADTYTAAGAVDNISTLGINEATPTDTLNATLNVSGNGGALTVDASTSTHLTRINFTGDQDVTVQMDGAELFDLKAQLDETITNDVLVTTDSTTAGTTTLQLTTTILDGALDLSSVVVDNLSLALADITDGTNDIEINPGQLIIVDNDQDDLAVTADAALAATNSVTFRIADEDTTTTASASWEVAKLTAENMKTVTLELADTDDNDDGTYVTEMALGTAELVITGAGDLFTGTSITASKVTATNATGDLDIQLSEVVTTAQDITLGAGDDTLTDSGTAASYTIDGGAGVDTLELSTDYSAAGDNDLTLSNIEKIELALDSKVKANVMNGEDYIVTSAADNDIEIVGTVAGGETIDISNVTYTAAGTVTITGNVGVDIITGMANSVNIVNAGGGADQITGGAADNDTLNGEDGADTIIGGAGIDFIDGGNDADQITGGEGADIIIGGLGDDTIDLTETTSVADTVNYHGDDLTTVDGSSVESILGFTLGSDIISFDTSDNDDGTDDSSVTNGAEYTNGVLTDVTVLAAVAADTSLADALIEILANTDVDNNDVLAFEYDGNTYLIHSDADTEAGNVVELTGITGVTSLTETSDEYVIA